MNKFIEVYDNLFSSDFIDRIEKTVFSNKTFWTYTPNLEDKSASTYAPGFGHHFINGDQGITSPLGFEFTQVLYNFLEKQNLILNHLFNGRAFLQVPSNGNNSVAPHVDGRNPHWVCLYYINNSDGDTIFYKDDKTTEIKRVTPKKGRVAFFDGSIYHSAGIPQKNHRAVLNFCFEGEKI